MNNPHTVSRYGLKLTEMRMLSIFLKLKYDVSEVKGCYIMNFENIYFLKININIFTLMNNEEFG